jgi:hypothetical protein
MLGAAVVAISYGLGTVLMAEIWHRGVPASPKRGSLGYSRRSPARWSTNQG